jgi:MFS family permease
LTTGAMPPHNTKKTPKLFYGWVIAVCCFFGSQAYGFFFSLGIFFKPLQQEFGWGAGLISTIHSLHLAVLVVALPLLGRLTDRYGARRMFGVSAVFMGVGFFLCGLVNQLWQFYLFYLIASLGVGATTALPTAIVQKWFIKKKGLALGIAASGIGAGPLIAAPVSELLISFYGWRNAYFIIGGLVWLVLALVALAMVDRPEDIGLCPLGQNEIDTLSKEQRGNTSFVSNTHDHQLNKKEWTTKDAMKTRAFLILGAIWLLSALPIHMIMIHIVPFVVNCGIPQKTAAFGLGLIGGISVLGRLSGGALSDIVGLKKSLAIATFISAFAMIGLPFVKGSHTFFVFVVIYGYFWGARVPQIPGLIGNYFGNRNLNEIMGIFWAIAGIGAIIGALTGGFVFDLTGSYFIAFMFAAGCFGGSCILTTVLKPPNSNDSVV